MKRGEADHTGPQPPVGTIQIDGYGRRWRKVRRVDDWPGKLVRAIAEVRVSGMAGREPDLLPHIESLGYELDTSGEK